MLISSFSLFSCKGNAGDIGPQGPQGIQGEPGNDGKTPYIGENGNWWIGESDTGVKALIEELEFPYILASSYGILPGLVDSNKLQNIIDDQSISNKTIVFADGTYIFSSTINLASNITLLGNSNTIFMLNNSSENTVLLNINNVDNINIKNLSIAGNNISRPSVK